MSLKYILAKNNPVYYVFTNSQLTHTFTCYTDYDPLYLVFLCRLFMVVVKSYWITAFPQF